MHLLKTVILFFLIAPALAQNQSGSSAIGEINKLATTYKGLPYLSFNLNYYYSQQETPDKYIDSLKGSVKLHGNQCWYSLDSTEAVTTDEFAIALFKEDKIMYISKSPVSNQITNPITMLDSLQSKSKDISFSVREIADKKIVFIDFNEGMVFKKIEYYIDNKTGLLSKVKMLVRSNQLYDPSLKGLINDNNSYSNIDVFYTNYNKSPIDDQVFNTSRYFKRNGKEFLPIAPYDSFKIFVGSL